MRAWLAVHFPVRVGESLEMLQPAFRWTGAVSLPETTVQPQMDVEISGLSVVETPGSPAGRGKTAEVTEVVETGAGSR